MQAGDSLRVPEAESHLELRSFQTLVQQLLANIQPHHIGHRLQRLIHVFQDPAEHLDGPGSVVVVKLEQGSWDGLLW